MIINSTLPLINNVPEALHKIGEKPFRMENNEQIPATDIDDISVSARQLTAAENITAARSPLRDPDLAREVLNFARENILADAGKAIDAHGRKTPDTGNLLGE